MIKREITEAELKVFGFCPKLYEYEVLLQYKNEMQIACKQMIEKFLLFQLKNGNHQMYDNVIPRIINESVEKAYVNHEDEREANGLKDLASKRLSSWFNDYINLFKLHDYQVVLGPYIPKVVISKTAIQLDIIGILYHKDTDTVHILSWFNDVKENNPSWDLGSIAKFLFAQKYTEKKVCIHFLDINYRNTYSKEFSMYIKSIPDEKIEAQNKIFLKEKIKEFEKYTNNYRIPYCMYYDCPKRKECQK